MHYFYLKRKLYHVRPVTQTDVVRAGTRDVAKIFQILYDVNAVSGPGAYTYLGGAYDHQTMGNTNTGSAKKGGGGVLGVSLIHPSALEASPSLYNSSILSTTTLHAPQSSSQHQLNSTSKTPGSNTADFSYAMDNTLVGINGPLNLDDYSTRLSADAISVGSNDSGDVIKVLSNSQFNTIRSQFEN